MRKFDYQPFTMMWNINHKLFQVPFLFYNMKQANKCKHIDIYLSGLSYIVLKDFMPFSNGLLSIQPTSFRCQLECNGTQRLWIIIAFCGKEWCLGILNMFWLLVNIIFLLIFAIEISLSVSVWSISVYRRDNNADSLSQCDNAMCVCVCVIDQALSQDGCIVAKYFFFHFYGPRHLDGRITGLTNTPIRPNHGKRMPCASLRNICHMF